MRVLVVGRDKLTKDQEREWQLDNGGRIRHMIPDARGDWHYANTIYSVFAGVRKKLAYWCSACVRGALLD